MGSGQQDLLLLALSWIAYCACHSLLASLRMKRWVARKLPEAMAAYRLAFNALATILLLPPLWLMLRFDGPLIFVWAGPSLWISLGLTLAALTGFVCSLRYYDIREFLGLRQWADRDRREEDRARLRISPLHRFVRHPWYSLALVLIWCREMDAAMLISALVISAYFLLGSRFEEQKLIRYHGDAYRKYQARVPALVPLPWRYLDQTTARALERESRPGAH